MAKSRRKQVAEQKSKKQAAGFFKILIGVTIVLLILLYLFFIS